MKLTIESALRGEHDEYLNQKLCEWLGWKVHPKNKGLVIDPRFPNSVQPFGTMPDHINGESALFHCHEAEDKILTTQKLRDKYKDNLTIRMPGEGTTQNGWTWKHTYHATARQRTVALLLTVMPEVFTC